MTESDPNDERHAFGRLEGNDLYASVIAICVRNAMEEFHCDRALGLTDDVMARLNPVIRRAVWEALELFGEPTDDERQRWARSFLLHSIPDYWEPPSTLPPVGCLP